MVVWSIIPQMLSNTILAYFSAAAQRSPHVVKFDCLHMHCVNASLFFPYINRQDFLSTANKGRLLEWFGRTTLALYVACGSTPLSLEAITSYKPKQPTPAGTDPWLELFARGIAHEDDGHGVKMLRAVRAGKETSSMWEEKRQDFKI
jgi:hypothetical protein